jgi:hypothetical protein
MVFSSKDSLSQTIGRWRAQFRHAFTLSTQQEQLGIPDTELLDRVAEAIVKRGMAAPAMVFLESIGPMNFLGSQALHFLTPILEFAFNAKEVDQVARLLERRDTIAKLIGLIEAKSAPQGAPAR